jgi:hypothetical protein
VKGAGSTAGWIANPFCRRYHLAIPALLAVPLVAVAVAVAVGDGRWVTSSYARLPR